MLIEKDLIINAKKEFGDRAVQVIAEDLNLERFDEKNKKASCPFGHSDTDPSFIWNDKDACFHCFSCGKNYGILDHYIDHYNLTFLGAVEKLFVSGKFLRDAKIKKNTEIENLLKMVQNTKGEVLIVSGQHDFGKQLEGIGGIAALNRYRVV